MTFGQVAGFFLDSCVLLPQSLESTYEACSNLISEDKPCFVSQSIKDEGLLLSKECFTVISTTLRYYLKPALERNGINEITKKDGKTIARVFSDQKKRIIKEFPTKSNVRGELVGILENYMAKRVHSLKETDSLPIDDLLANALVELEKARYEIEKPFKKVETIYANPSSELTSFPPLKRLVNNQKDILHLASAVSYQFQVNKWVIFVTNDEKEILSNDKDLWEIFSLQCSKPSWALDYYQDLTKLESPVEYYRNKLIPTQEQREFGDIIEKALGVRILRKPFEGIKRGLEC